MRDHRRVPVRFFVLLVLPWLGLTTEARADLVSHWPLNEDFENVVDALFDGYLVDLPVPAFVDFAAVELNEDGSGPTQDFAAVFTGPDSFVQTDFPGIGGTDSRTIACWIKTSQPGGNDILGYGTPTNFLKWHMRVNTSAANGVVGALRTEIQGGQIVGTTRIDDGLWHHLVVVFPDGATMAQEIDQYIDGVLQGKSGIDVAINTDIDNVLYRVTIGLTRQSATAVRVFRGLIADVRIYDHALSNDDIYDVIGVDPPTPCATLAVSCDVDEELELVSAQLTTTPAECACTLVQVTAGKRDLGLRAASPEGVVDLGLAEVCVGVPGEDVELTFTCSGTESSDVCVVSCPARRGLVAHWSLSEGSGTTFNNLADDAFPGFLDGGVVSWERVVEDGNANRPPQEFAVRCSGVNSWIQTDYLGVGGGLPRTICFWIKTNATGASDFLGYGRVGNGLKWHMRVNTNTGNGLRGAIRTEYQGGQNVGTTVVDDGFWHHIAAVFPEGATMGQEILHYVDGVVQGHTGGDRLINTAIDAAFPVLIGRSQQNATSRNYNGLIADVRMYDGEIDVDGIEDIMTAEPPEPIPVIDCTELTITCEVDARLNTLRATVTRTPEDCSCGGFLFSAGEVDLGSRPVGPDGSVELRLDEICSIPGSEIELEVRCAGLDVTAFCELTCPERVGLVAHWPLDEGDGEIFVDVVGVDDGYLIPPSTIVWGEGPPTQEFAVEFNGLNSWIQTDFPGIGGANARTIACWIKTTAPNNDNHGIVSWGPDAAGEKWHIRLNNSAVNGPVMALRTEVNGGYTISTTPLNDGEWHHIAVVVPEGARVVGDIVHYVDGVLEVQGGLNDRPFSTRLSGPNVRQVGIGRRVPGNGINGNYFPGSIADVRIYDEAIDEEEILDLVFGDSPRENCSNGADDDDDGLVDCDDPDCEGRLSCVEVCDNGQDDDGDELVDCDDPDCDGQPECVEICDNKMDDDGDGLVDCLDDDCTGDPSCPTGVRFVRGDSNSSGIIDLTDGVVTLGFLFTGGPVPACRDAADTDGNNALVISDAVIIFSYLFTGGPAPVPPSPIATNYPAEDCGPDPDEDALLDCATPPAKCQ